jgi:hypothetical protein
MLWSPLCFRLCSLVNIFAVAVTSERFCAFALFVHEVDVGGRAILFAPFSKSFGWERRATSLLCEDPGTSFAFALCFGSCKDAQRCAFARLRQRKGARRCHSSIPTGGPMAFRNDLRYIAGKGSRFLWSHVSGRRRRPLRGRTVKGTRGSSRARQTRSRVTFRDAKRWQRGGQHEAILGTTSNYHFHPSIRQKPSNRIRYDVVDGVRGGFGSHGLGSLQKKSINSGRGVARTTRRTGADERQSDIPMPQHRDPIAPNQEIYHHFQRQPSLAITQSRCVRSVNRGHRGPRDSLFPLHPPTEELSPQTKACLFPCLFFFLHANPNLFPTCFLLGVPRAEPVSSLVCVQTPSFGIELRNNRIRGRFLLASERARRRPHPLWLRRFRRKVGDVYLPVASSIKSVAQARKQCFLTERQPSCQAPCRSPTWSTRTSRGKDLSCCLRISLNCA